MLNVVKKTNKLLLIGFLLVITFLIHNYLASFLVINKNFGISFGLNNVWLFIIYGLSLVIITFKSIKENSLGLMLLTIGGLVNLIDRLIFGYVRDYWNFLHLGVYNNLNDWLIGIAVLLLVREIWKKSK